MLLIYMPYSRKRRSRRNTRPRRKKSSFGGRVTQSRVQRSVMRSAPSPFGNRFKTTLKSSLYLNINPAAAYTSFLVQTNSLFDPMGTAGAVQALGRDELAALYLSYKITSFVLKVTWISSTAAPTMLGLVCGSDAAALAYSGPAELAAAPGGIHTLVLPTANQSRAKSLTIKRYCSTILGLNKYEFMDTTYTATVGSNPGEMAYVSVPIMSVDGTNVTGTLFVELEQIVTFSGRKQLALS